jgi:sarcosine oxidase
MDRVHQSSTKNILFDVIVIGVGSMGSSACYFLAKRGYKILGIEQFDITHEFGSHAGQSRIIRKAYFEDPNYIPLLNQAYKNWKKFEEETGSSIYHRTGLVYFGDQENEMIKGIKRSASLFNIPLENLDAKQATNRFPQFKFPKDFEILFEAEAGFITPEKAIKLYSQQAEKIGAEIHTNEKVVHWKKNKTDVIVTTEKNKYQCKKLVITAGAWIKKLVPELNNTIKITRQFVAWIKPKHQKNFLINHFPCWMIADNEKPGCYYGFPVLPESFSGGAEGLKLAHHFPGIETDPDHVTRQATVEDKENLIYFLNKYLPGAFDSFLATKICLYANTPDQNFIIDKLPDYEDDVIIACGFSGHGFKFVSVVGEILADLAIERITKFPIQFLNAKRFA